MDVADTGNPPTAAEHPDIVRQNIAVIAHIDAGKTTVTEQLLYLSGAVRYAGAVEDGTTVTDWQEAEQRRGITIGSAAVSFRWSDREVTVVDTPGHVDFTVEVERTLRVIEGGVVVFTATDGIQAQTETVWHQAAKHKLPVIGFVNKLDRPGWDLEALQADIRDRFAIEPLPLQFPIDDLPEGYFGLIDVLSGERRVWDDVDRRQPARRPQLTTLSDDEELERQVALERIVDHVALVDDDFASAVLGGAKLLRSDYEGAIRRAAANRLCLPLLLGVARGGAGLIGLADAVVGLLPTSEETRTQTTYDVDTGRRSDPLIPALGRPLTAFVFKTERRPDGLRVAYTRVFSGTLKLAASALRLPGRQHFTALRLVRLFGGTEETCAELAAGSIGGIVCAGEMAGPTTGETIVVPGTDAALEPIGAPTPVISMTLSPETTEAEAELQRLLQEYVTDDPSLSLGVDPATGLTVVSGMGELHLEITMERLVGVLGDQVSAGKLRPDLRHLISQPVRSVGRAGTPPEVAPAQWVEVEVEVAPADGPVGTVVRYDNEGTRGPIEAGIGQALSVGPLGRPETGFAPVRVVVKHVSASAVVPLPVYFVDAARQAVSAALRQGHPTLAEPWMNLKIMVPDAHVGSVVSDLARRRGRVNASETRGDVQVLSAEAPLGLLIGYATGLRSLTGGRGIFTMSPSGYRTQA